MCLTDRHDMTLAVKVAFNPNTTNQPTVLKKVLGLVLYIFYNMKKNLKETQILIG